MPDDQAVHRLIAGIYDVALAPEQWSGILDEVSGAVGAGIEYLSALQLPARVGPAANLRFEPERAAAYFAGRRGDRPQGRREAGSALLLRRPGASTQFGVLRFGRARSRVAARMDVARCLVPHFQQAVQLYLRFGALQAERAAAAELFDQLPLGVILLGGDGRAARLNRLAEAIVAEADGFTLRRGRPAAAVSRENAALGALITQASAAALGHGRALGGAMTISRPSLLRPFALRVAPLRVGGDRTTAAILIGDPERRPQTPTLVLAELYRLTPAEARLAALLVQGEKLEEAAAALAISMNTARGCLKQVFAKTGTRRQAELMSAILRGPAGLSLD